jgi:L-threonylcarbamoyladenylate synthase
METLRLTVDPYDLASKASRSSLKRAAEILRSGGTVALPTETVYGLGANALDAAAIAKIFAAKERPSWDPLIVHISDTEMLRQVVASIPESATKLIDAFWPGPLTLLMPKGDAIPGAVTAGRPRVGVRMPQHPVAYALIREAGVPIAAPSANRFGRTSPTTAEHVAEDLEGRIDAILDSGETTHGLESTVIDTCQDPCVVYRPGVISLEQIRAAGVDAVIFRDTAEAHAARPESLPSPGVGLRHYAPRARLILIDGAGEAQIAAFDIALKKAQQNGETIGLMLPDEFESAALRANGAIIYRWGKWSDAGELAKRLFAGLRSLDKAGTTVILCPLPAAAGIGVAIRDRLSKAARSD